MLPYLPIDVVVDILSRLPVKSLLRLICVCKTWYALIKNPSFVSAHTNQSISNPPRNPPLLLIRSYNMFNKIETLALRFDNPSFNVYSQLKCPFNTVNEYFRIVGSCNGLICLADDYDKHTDTIIIWNPSVRRSVTLPKPQVPCVYQGPFGDSCLVGFGYDSLRGDYKIVRILYQYKISNDPNEQIPPLVEIFSLRERRWRSIISSLPLESVLYSLFPLPCFLNGSVHWIGSKRLKKGTSCSLIGAFDMGAEAFRDVLLPDSISETEVLKLSISVMGSSLAVVHYEAIWESQYCWIWVMKEYGKVESWTKLYTIDMRGGIRKVAGFGNNEIFLSARARGLLSYDPHSQKIRHLGIQGTNKSFFVDNYVESLVLLVDEDRQLSEGNSLDNVCGERETSAVQEEDSD